MCLTIKAIQPDEADLIRKLRRKKKKFMHLINEKSMVATEDIQVYKVLESLGNLCANVNLKWRSPFVNMQYKFEKEYSAKFKFDYYRDCMQVSNGLHSYSSELRAKNLENKNLAENIYQVRKVFAATIPKGTRYFVGDDNDIVSEKLIVHSGKLK